jgi:hypothetical protein
MNRSMNPVAATRLLILGAALAAVTAACGAGFNVSAAGAADPGGANGVAVPSPATVSAELDVVRIAKDLRAASARHDSPTANADQELLASRLGRAQLESLDSTYRLALADVQVAMVSHDATGIAQHRAEFERLCGPGTLASLLYDCDADLATVMR